MLLFGGNGGAEFNCRLGLGGGDSKIFSLLCDFLT
jgi:hypothetical protein